MRRTYNRIGRIAANRGVRHRSEVLAHVSMKSPKAQTPVHCSRGTILAGLLLAAAVLAVYLPALRAGFIWDDDHYLTENPLIRASDGLYRFWFTTEPTDYYPLFYSSLWLEWRLWGNNPWGYHLVNLLLHAGSTVLLWRVLQRLKVPGAWVAAMLFGVHPVNVATVAWISERKNTLCLLFYLSAMFSYLRFDQGGRRRWYGLAIVCFVAAMLSKTAVVMFPLVLLLCAWWMRRRVRWADVIRVAPFVAVSLALGIVTMRFQASHAPVEQAARLGGFSERVVLAGWAVWFYLYKTLWPLGLSVIYPRWDLSHPTLWSFLPDAAVVIVLTVCWWYRQAWGRAILFGFGYFLLMLLPVLGFVDIGFMTYSLVADHWLYPAIMGIIALAAGLATAGAGRMSLPRRASVPPAVAIVLALAVLTWQRGRVYQSPLTLWRDTVARNPRAWVAHSNLALAFKDAGQLDQAIHHFSRAVALKSDSVKIRTNYGVALLQGGRPADAIEQFEAALALNPNSAAAHYNLGNALGRIGRLDEAVRHYRQALELQGDYSAAYNNLGNLLFKRGQTDQAIAVYNELLRRDPNDFRARVNLGRALAKKGRLDQAVAEFRRATQINPRFAMAYNNLGSALLLQHKFDQAIPALQRAVQLNPRLSIARLNLGIAWEAMGDLDRAIDAYRQALTIDPRSAQAAQRLQKALAKRGQSSR